MTKRTEMELTNKKRNMLILEKKGKRNKRIEYSIYGIYKLNKKEWKQREKLTRIKRKIEISKMRVESTF